MINFPRKTQFQLGSTPPSNDASVFGSTAAGSTVYTDDILQQQCGLSGATPTAQWIAGFLSGLVGNGSPISVDHAALHQMALNQIAYILQKMGALYDANTTYYAGDVCTFGSPPIPWQSLTNNNTGNTPGSSPSNWTLYGQVVNGPARLGSVTFDGRGTVGANCTIYGGFNVTSVLKNATGNYTANWTNDAPNANYGAWGSCGTLPGQAFANGDDNFLGFGFTGIGAAVLRSTTQTQCFCIQAGGTPVLENSSMITLNIG